MISKQTTKSSSFMYHQNLNLSSISKSVFEIFKEIYNFQQQFSQTYFKRGVFSLRII